MVIYESVSFGITCEERKLPSAAYFSCVVCELLHTSGFTLCALKEVTATGSLVIKKIKLLQEYESVIHPEISSDSKFAKKFSKS